MAHAIDPDFPAVTPDADKPSVGWLGRAIRRLLPGDASADADAPREGNGDDRDPPELPPSWFLT